eukprot:COSAG01_NODE_1689_length_9488_cov_5.759825_5_plen_130_part_00
MRASGAIAAHPIGELGAQRTGAPPPVVAPADRRHALFPRAASHVCPLQTAGEMIMGWIDLRNVDRLRFAYVFICSRSHYLPPQATGGASARASSPGTTVPVSHPPAGWGSDGPEQIWKRKGISASPHER